MILSKSTDDVDQDFALIIEASRSNVIPLILSTVLKSIRHFSRKQDSLKTMNFGQLRLRSPFSSFSVNSIGFEQFDFGPCRFRCPIFGEVQLRSLFCTSSVNSGGVPSGSYRLQWVSGRVVSGIGKDGWDPER